MNVRLILGFAFVLCMRLFAQDFIPTHTNYEVESTDDFMDISGNTVVTAKSFSAHTLSNERNVSIFEKDIGGENNWGLVKQLVSPIGVDSNFYGCSAAICGDWLIVGDMRPVQNGEYLGGKAYLYQRNLGGKNNWGLFKEFYDSSPLQYVYKDFAKCVAINGDYLFIVTYQDTVGTGSQYNSSTSIYSRNYGGENNWGFVKKILNFELPSNLSQIDEIVCSENYLAVHDRYKKRVILFGKNIGGEGNWGKIKQFFLDAHRPNKFDINGNNLALLLLNGEVNIYFKNSGGENNWGLEKTIDDQYTGSISLKDNLLVVTNPEYESETGYNGTVSVYERNYGGDKNWGRKYNYNHTVSSQYLRFGIDCYIESDKIFVSEGIPYNEHLILHVMEEAENTIPFFKNPIYNVEITAGNEFSHQFEFHDYDWDSCEVNIETTLGPNMSFSEDGLFSFTPDETQTGSHEAVFSLTDNNNGIVYDTLKIFVFAEEIPAAFTSHQVVEFKLAGYPLDIIDVSIDNTTAAISTYEDWPEEREVYIYMYMFPKLIFGKE